MYPSHRVKKTVIKWTIVPWVIVNGINIKINYPTANTKQTRLIAITMTQLNTWCYWITYTVAPLDYVHRLHWITYTVASLDYIHRCVFGIAHAVGPLVLRTPLSHKYCVHFLFTGIAYTVVSLGLLTMLCHQCCICRSLRGFPTRKKNCLLVHLRKKRSKQNICIMRF